MQVTKRCANNHHTLIFNISESKVNNSTNKSTISWSIQLSADASWSFSQIGSTIVAKINGVTVYNKYEQRSCNGGTTATWASGTLEVEHNSDGSKTVAFECSYSQSSTASYTPGNANLNGNLSLTKIPRHTSIKSFSVSKRSETSVTFNWETADTIDYVWFSKDNGDNWNGLDVADGTSGSFNVGSLTPNTKYNFKLRVRRKDGQLTTDSSVVSQTTYKIPTQSLNQKTETTIKVNWTIDSTADRIQYSYDNGKTWSTTTTVNATSGNYTISGLLPNTTYSIKTRIRRASSQTTYDTSSLAVKTYDYPYCTETPNFKIGNKLTLKFYNPLERTFKFYIISNGTQIENNWTISGTSYSGIDANDTQNQLYATIPNLKSATYQVKVVYGSSTKIRTNNNIVSIQGNEKPIFTSDNISYQDSNTSVVAITQNNQQIVRQQSNLKISYTAAAPKKFAEIQKYEITFNGSTQTKSTAMTIDYGKINLSTSVSVTIIVTDTRGLTAKATKLITILDWILPTATILAKRINNYEDTTKIKIQSKFSSVSGKNSIQEMKFRYKKASEDSWSNYTNLNNNVEKNIVIDKLYQWNLQILVRDKFGATTYNLVIPKGMPIMFLDILKLAVGVNCFPTNSESFCVNGSDFLEYEMVSAQELLKTFKYKKNIFLDSCGIVHNKQTLDDLLPRYFQHYDGADADLNNVVQEGLYMLGNTFKNAPYIDSIFGVLIVVTARHFAWKPEDFGNWLWQIIMDTKGRIYRRIAVNTETFTDWECLNDDSGWKDLPLATGISVGSIKKKAQYRKVGKMVQVRGDVQGIAKGDTLIATLPTGFRPSSRIDSIQPLSRVRYCRYRIESSGQIILEWTSDSNYNASWYNLDITFMTD